MNTRFKKLEKFSYRVHEPSKPFMSGQERRRERRKLERNRN